MRFFASMHASYGGGTEEVCLAMWFQQATYRDIIMKKSLGMVVGLAALIAASASHAAEIKFVNIATASTSGSFYPAGLAISKLINDNLGVRASAQASAGSVENVSILRNGEANIALIQNNVVRDALEGKGTFKGKKFDKLRVLAPLFVNTDHLVVAKSAGIKTLADIKGKRWAVGSPGSGTMLSNKAILTGGSLTFDDIKPEYLGQTEAMAALQNGIIDGADLTSGVPFSQLQQLLMSAGNRVMIYSMTPQEQKNVIERSGWKAPFTIPAGTYKGQTEPILTVSHLSLIMVTTDFPDDLAYNILTVMHKNVDKLKAAHGAFRSFDLTQALEKIESLKLPINGGAKRFFAGL